MSIVWRCHWEHKWDKGTHLLCRNVPIVSRLTQKCDFSYAIRKVASPHMEHLSAPLRFYNSFRSGPLKWSIKNRFFLYKNKSEPNGTVWSEKGMSPFCSRQAFESVFSILELKWAMATNLLYRNVTSWLTHSTNFYCSGKIDRFFRSKKVKFP